jgi:hypothetical protein
MEARVERVETRLDGLDATVASGFGRLAAQLDRIERRP